MDTDFTNQGVNDNSNSDNNDNINNNELKNENIKDRNDNNSLYDSESKRLYYKDCSYPRFKETRALFIGNIEPQFDIERFKNLLIEEAKKENGIIERAWLNNSRTHCYILCSEVLGAVAIRKRLNGKTLNIIDDNNNNNNNNNNNTNNNFDKDFILEEESEIISDRNDGKKDNKFDLTDKTKNSNEKNGKNDNVDNNYNEDEEILDQQVENSSNENIQRNNNFNHKLFVDFIPVKAVDSWIEAERENPIDAIWRISYFEEPSIAHPGTKFKMVTHVMINYPNDSTGYVRGHLPPLNSNSQNSSHHHKPLLLINRDNHRGNKYSRNTGRSRDRRSRSRDRRDLRGRNRDRERDRDYRDRDRDRERDRDHRDRDRNRDRRDSERVSSNSRISKRSSQRRADVYIPKY